MTKTAAKLAVLTDVLSRGKNLALAAAATVSDDGACNFDSVFLSIPRVSKNAVVSAISAAGLHSSSMHWLGRPGYLICPPEVGQGDKRTKAMETIWRCLKDAGFNAFGWYQMD